jgi:hypothetical protein
MFDRVHAVTLAVTFVLTRLLLTLGGCYADQHPPPPPLAADAKDASP